MEHVELVSATPHYACVRYPDGRESTVSTRDLAPAGVQGLRGTEEEREAVSVSNESERLLDRQSDVAVPTPSSHPPSPPVTDESPREASEECHPRRSVRIRRAPDRLNL